MVKFLHHFKIGSQKTIKEYEYLLNEKKYIGNYIKYLDTACELANVDKIQVIEIVQNNKKEYDKQVIGLDN